MTKKELMKVILETKISEKFLKEIEPRLDVVETLVEPYKSEFIYNLFETIDIQIQIEETTERAKKSVEKLANSYEDLNLSLRGLLQTTNELKNNLASTALTLAGGLSDTKIIADS